ncbi:MAG: peptidoglycan editing factor PgeF [Desulfatiglandaceae bacterium]
MPIFCYDHLSRYSNLIHGVFTRAGGISDPPYEHLNTSYSVGDRPDAVSFNLTAIQKAIRASHLVFMNQSHSDTVSVLRRYHLCKDWRPPMADALITDLPHVAILIKQADCQSVILFDPETRVVANVHCGWRGNVKNILGQVVHRMNREFGSTPHRMVAAIGPSLGPCCAEFVDFEDYFPDLFREFRVNANHFDLWAISRYQLIRAGVPKENIACAQICTRCRTDLFYSYRGEGTTGRFGTVVMLKPDTGEN